MNNNWTKDAQTAINLCSDWAKRVVKDVPAEFFLFGSAIYNGGEQFYSDQSDLDIIALLPDPSTPLERVRSLQKLLGYKAELELEMIQRLCRTSCVESGVSIVPVTKFELRANVHKSGARRFFTKNQYLNLVHGNQTLGIDDAGTLSLDDEHRYALEFVQKTRNEYLSVCANGTGGLRAHMSSDPMPKALLRVAAQMLADVPEGAWYDTRLGLEFMHQKLADVRGEDPLFGETFDTISVRRGGRGQLRPLTGLHQLVLAEILFESGCNGQTSPIATWSIRVSGSAFDKDEANRVWATIVKLVPGAELLKVRAGSIIFEMRGDGHGYANLKRLKDLGVLHTLLEVEACELGETEDSKAPFDPSLDRGDFESKLLAQIAGWRPGVHLKGRGLEDEFARLLKQLHEKGVLPNFDYSRNVIVDGGRAFELDFVVRWFDSEDQWEELPIDLSVVSSAALFFRKIDRLLALNIQIVMVCVTTSELKKELEPDVWRLSNVSRKVTVVFVTSDVDK